MIVRIIINEIIITNHIIIIVIIIMIIMIDFIGRTILITWPQMVVPPQGDQRLITVTLQKVRPNSALKSARQGDTRGGGAPAFLTAWMLCSHGR